MAENDAGQRITVSCRECRCPGTPGTYHANDEVYLAPEPSLDLAMAAQFVLEDAREATPGNEKAISRALIVGWTKVYVTHGVLGWNLVDENGLDAPLSIPAILADVSLAGPVADQASTLYTAKITRPLGLAPAATSPAGRTVNSKSRTKRSTGTRHEPSSPVRLAASPR